MTLSVSENKKLLYCVHCGTPCNSLYRQYTSSTSSIKLTSCENCHQIVDPYIEREWLLVLLDCLLLRIEAYRHVLYHRIDHHIENRAIQSLIASSLLESYISWEAQLSLLMASRNDVAAVEPLSFWFLYARSILGMVALWLGSSIVAKYIVRKEPPGDLGRSTSSKTLFWGLLLPTSFHVVTILVLVWENSFTVKRLGSLYVVCMQYLGLQAAMVDNRKQGSNYSPSASALWVLLGGLAARALVRQALARFSPLPLLACTGLFYNKWCLT